MSIFENQAIEIEKSCTKNNGGMKMKALASDFDRTLFFYDESGSYYRLEDVQAIKHFQSLIYLEFVLVVHIKELRILILIR